jgi:hypothetical protein
MMETGSIFGFLGTHPEVVIAAGSALVALISAVIARGETGRQRRLQTERLRQSIDAASLEWGGQAIDTLARAAMLARTRHMHANDAGFEAGRTSSLMALTALIDRGRLFFPNLDPERKGADKELAYRGSRPPILDALVWSYCEVEALRRTGGEQDNSAAEFIDDCRRLLVSELQAHLDPRRLDQVVGRYQDQKEADRKVAIGRADELREQLKSRHPGISLDRRNGSAPPAEARA